MTVKLRVMLRSKLMVQISIVAEKLNIYTLQRVAVRQNQIVVPTLDGQLLSVTAQGASTILADLLKAELGIPFGIVDQGDDVIVTVSNYTPDHYLVRVKPDGQVSTIANLSQLCGEFGAPFGVAVYQNQYWVTLSPDVAASKGQLLSISPTGKITPIAVLNSFGIPFGITVWNGAAVIAQSYGQLVQVSPTGITKTIVDLQALKFGIPFDVAVWQNQLVATTNTGQVVRIDAAGTVTTIADLAQEKRGIPAGIAVSGNDLIVTTNSGFLIRITV